MDPIGTVLYTVFGVHIYRYLYLHVNLDTPPQVDSRQLAVGPARPIANADSSGRAVAVKRGNGVPLSSIR